MLNRAIRPLWGALEEMDRLWLPVERSWRLNERHFSGLQGLDKAETAVRMGAGWPLTFRLPSPRRLR